MMITVGIDIGLENTKAAVLKDGVPMLCKSISSGLEKRKEKALALLEELTAESGAHPDKVIITGQGAGNMVGFTTVTEPIADAAFAKKTDPKVKMVVDLGADQVRVVKLGEGSAIEGVVLNQKCSACLGLMMETMELRLGMSMDEFGAVDATADNLPTLNSGCAVFSELDAYEHMFKGCEREKVAASLIHTAAVRINALLHDKFVPENNGLLVGGAAKLPALVYALEKRSGLRFRVPENAEFAGAIGCAVIAHEMVSGHE